MEGEDPLRLNVLAWKIRRSLKIKKKHKQITKEKPPKKKETLLVFFDLLFSPLPGRKDQKTLRHSLRITRSYLLYIYTLTQHKYRSKSTPWKMKLLMKTCPALNPHYISLCVWTLNNVEWWQDFLHKKKMPRRAVLIFANSTRNQKKKKKNEKKL